LEVTFTALDSMSRVYRAVNATSRSPVTSCSRWIAPFEIRCVPTEH
jgi:hypothetical protein